MNLKRFLIAALMACPVIVLSSADSAWAWAPGDPSTLTTRTDITNSCSMSTTGTTGQVFASTSIEIFGQCSWNPAVTTGTNRAAQWLALGQSLSDISEFKTCDGVTALCGNGRVWALRTPTAGFSTITSFTSAACPGVANCSTFRIVIAGYAGTGGTERHKIWTNVQVPSVQFIPTVNVATCTSTCATSSPTGTLAAFGAASVGVIQPSQQYWTAPYVPPSLECGTGGSSGSVTISTPKPSAGNPLTDPGRTAVIEPGKLVTVAYLGLPEDGIVYAKFADQDTWAQLSSTGAWGQKINLYRSPTKPATTARSIEFKCIMPSSPSTPLYSRFVVNAADTAGGGDWQVFVSTTAQVRDCFTLSIWTDLPRVGYIPTTTPEVFHVVTTLAHDAGDVRVSYEWGVDADTWPTAAWTASESKEFTIPASSDEDVNDRYYERLKIMCRDSQGNVTLRGALATNEIDPLSTDLFPNSTPLSACFEDMGGMQLDSPSSWVRGAGEMTSCILRTLFIPSEMDMDALRRRLDEAGGDWVEPIDALVSGMSQITSVSGSCSYTVTLPINGGFDMVFDSCSGHVATGRTLVYTASSVSIALYGLIWLRRKATAVLTMNAHAANTSEAIRFEGQRQRTGDDG